jgi:hypothetical protein
MYPSAPVPTCYVDALQYPCLPSPLHIFPIRCDLSVKFAFEFPRQPIVFMMGNHPRFVGQYSWSLRSEVHRVNGDRIDHIRARGSKCWRADYASKWGMKYVCCCAFATTVTLVKHNHSTGSLSCNRVSNQLHSNK